MGRAEFRFYAELNDFLAPARRFRPFPAVFTVPTTVKHWIESFGVPHTEVELILVDGESVGFDRRVEDGARVSVYPMFEALDVSALLRVRPAPLREIRFVLDTHLGKLARYLRMAGFDCVYGRDWGDALLAGVSRRDSRVLLTRDLGLLKRNEVTRGYAVRETQPGRQAREVLRRFDLFDAMRPLTRCLMCNDPLTAAGPGLWRCPSCERLYWKGSHYRRMLQFLEELRRG